MENYTADDFMLAWTPNKQMYDQRDFQGAAPRGAVRVGPRLSKADWSYGYACTAGCCDKSWLDMTRDQRARELFFMFHDLVICDNIDPRQLHSELMKIDLFRQIVSPEITGFEPVPTEAA